VIYKIGFRHIFFLFLRRNEPIKIILRIFDVLIYPVFAKAKTVFVNIEYRGNFMKIKSYASKSLMPIGMLFLSVFISGCASIISKDTYPMKLDSDPKGAKVQIIDQYGRVVFQDITPTTAQIDVGDGFFKKADYTIKFELDGHMTKIYKPDIGIDPTYVVGNLFFGQIIGWLVIDPATGAMWELKSRYLHADFTGGESEIGDAGNTIRIMHIDSVPEELREYLEPVQTAE
jgi:hypothetical protein